MAFITKTIEGKTDVVETRKAAQKKTLQELIASFKLRTVKGKIDLNQNELIHFFSEVKEIYGKGDFEFVLPLEKKDSANKRVKDFLKLGAKFIKKEDGGKEYVYITDVYKDGKLIYQASKEFETNFTHASKQVQLELIKFGLINKPDFRAKKEKLEGVDFDEIQEKLLSGELKRIPEIVREMAAFNKQIKDPELRSAVDKARSIIYSADMSLQTEYYKQFVQGTQDFLGIIDFVANLNEPTPHGSTYKEKFTRLCKQYGTYEDAKGEMYLRLVQAAKLYDPHFLANNSENYDAKASFASYLISKAKSFVDDLEFSSRGLNSYGMRTPTWYKQISGYVMSACRQWEELNKGSGKKEEKELELAIAEEREEADVVDSEDKLDEEMTQDKELWILNRANEMFFEKNKVKNRESDAITIDKLRDVMRLEYGLISFEGEENENGESSTDALEKTIASQNHGDDYIPSHVFIANERKEVFGTITSGLSEIDQEMLYEIKTNPSDFLQMKKKLEEKIKAQLIEELGGEEAEEKFKKLEKVEALEYFVNLQSKYLDNLYAYAESRLADLEMKQVIDLAFVWNYLTNERSGEHRLNDVERAVYILGIEYGWDRVHITMYINHKFGLKLTDLKIKKKISEINTKINLYLRNFDVRSLKK